MDAREVNAIAGSLKLSTWARAFDLARPACLLALYVLVCARGYWLLAPPIAFVCFLSGFVLTHDAMHHALGLPKLANEVVLALAGALMLKSGHGLRATHLRHHGRVLERDDPEGGVVHWTLGRVLWAGPFAVLGNRRRAIALDPRSRGLQLLETLGNVAAFALMVWIAWGWRSPAGLIYFGAVVLLSSTLSLWAAYLPHVMHSDHPLIRVAAWGAHAWTPVLNSLAYHDLHHRCPKVATALLPALAAKVGPEVAFADHTIYDPNESGAVS